MRPAVQRTFKFAFLFRKEALSHANEFASQSGNLYIFRNLVEEEFSSAFFNLIRIFASINCIENTTFDILFF